MVGHWAPWMAGLQRMQGTEWKREPGMEQWERRADWGQKTAGMWDRMYGRAGCCQVGEAPHGSVSWTMTAGLEYPPGVPHKGPSTGACQALPGDSMVPLASQLPPPPMTQLPTCY